MSIQQAQFQATRDLQDYLGRGNLRVQGMDIASREAVARQNLGLQGYQGAEAADLNRRDLMLRGAAQQSQETLGAMGLSAGLRGSSNAFQQLQTNLGMGQAGLGNLAGALAGQYTPPQFQAPEAASLNTLARDMGSPSYGPGGGAGGFRAPSAIVNQAISGMEQPGQNIQGMQGIAGYNANNGGYGSPSTQWAHNLVNEETQGMKPAPLPTQPGPGPGAQWNARFQQLLAQNGGQVPPMDVLIREATPFAGSPAQAQAFLEAGRAYFQATGKPMHEGQINDALGQVKAGVAVDRSAWRDPGAGVQPRAPQQQAMTGLRPEGQYGITSGPLNQTRVAQGAGQAEPMMGLAGQPVMRTAQQQGQYRAPSAGPMGAAAPSQYSPSPYLQQQQRQAQAFLNQLPDPHKVNVAGFNRLPRSAQDFTMSAYAAKGYDPGDVTEQFGRMLPRAVGARRGFQAPSA
jgi:hypothetical protein